VCTTLRGATQGPIGKFHQFKAQRSFTAIGFNVIE